MLPVKQENFHWGKDIFILEIRILLLNQEKEILFTLSRRVFLLLE